MTQPSCADIFTETKAKISVQLEPQSLINAPHTLSLHKPQQCIHSNNHHNANHPPPQSNEPRTQHNGVSSKKKIRKIRLIIPRKRKLREMQSKATHPPSSDSKQNKENRTQQPPLKKQRLSPPPLKKQQLSPPPLKPKALLPPIQHQHHKPQPPSNHTSYVQTPIRNGNNTVHKHKPPTLLPPPPPLQSLSPPRSPPSLPPLRPTNNGSNPYLYLQSQLQTHYQWPAQDRSGIKYTHICNECGQGFMSGNALGGHKGQHTKAKARAKRQSVTQQKFKNHQYYYPNTNNQHPVQTNGNGNGIMKNTNNDNNGIYIEKKKRKRDLHNQRDINGNYPSHDKDGNAYKHFCDVCGKGFSLSPSLGGHRSVHKRMERMGKPYNKQTGKHEHKGDGNGDINGHNNNDKDIDNDIVMKDIRKQSVSSPTTHYVSIDEKEYKEYEGLGNTEIMNKIMDKLCTMDEAKLFHIEDTSTEYKAKVTESLSFTILKNKIKDNKYESVQQDFMADINKLFRFVFRVYTQSDIRYKTALKLKQFAYRQCMAALGSPASCSSSSLLSTSSRNEYRKCEYELQCLPMNGYEKIENYEFFCDDEVLKDKMTCKKSVSCDGTSCNDYSNLGPYCIASEQWKSDCLCRSKQMECSDDCKCDPLQCKNRSIQKHGHKQPGIQVREQEVFGMDQHTRMCIEKALPTQTKDVYTDCDNTSAKSYFIESLLCPAINNFHFFVLDHPEYASKYNVMGQNKPNESEATFMITDVLRTMLYKAETDEHQGERRVIEYMLCLILDMASDQLQTDISGIERSKRRMNYKDFKLFGVEWYLNNDLYSGGCDMICHFEFPIYSKGTGVVCIQREGIRTNEYIISFLGVVYSPWCWYEKDDRTRWLIKSRGAPKQPEFFNIMMEKHKDDADGYDLVFIDPSKKGNYGSRLSHSCSPNCISVSMGVNSKYNIAVYASSDIKYGDELCFNYNSVTENEQEWHDAVCLCGSGNCAGQFLIYAGTMLYTEVMKKAHHSLHRTAALFNANCGSDNLELSSSECAILHRYCLSSSALSGVPIWLKKYAVSICKYIDYEQRELPLELRSKALMGERGYSEFIGESAAAEESSGLKYVRLSNLVITLNKMNLFFRHPPNKSLMHMPLFKLYSPQQLIEKIWFNSNSIISQLYIFIAIYCGENHHILHRINEIRNAQTLYLPFSSDGVTLSRKYLLELRSELIALPPRYNAYHHAAADVLLMYASTRYFFYFYPPFQGFQSRVFTFNELGYTAPSEYHKYPPPKKYSPQYVWGQLNFWERHTIESPDSSLSAERRGSICLPNIKCCYVKPSQTHKRAYSYSVRKQFIQHLSNKPWCSWSTKWHFGFKNGALYGSPWLDAYIDEEKERPKFEQFLQIMKDTKMIYPDGTFIQIQDDDDDDDDAEQPLNMNDDDYKDQVKEEKETTNNVQIKNENQVGKATRRSSRLRGKQTPSYVEPTLPLYKTT